MLKFCHIYQSTDGFQKQAPQAICRHVLFDLDAGSVLVQIPSLHRKPFLSRRDLVPLGHTRRQFNFNIEEKRVLNFENEVSDSDNIKQDMSIDVYGRKEEDAPEPPKPKAEAQQAAPKKVIWCFISSLSILVKDL